QASRPSELHHTPAVETDVSGAAARACEPARPAASGRLRRATVAAPRRPRCQLTALPSSFHGGHGLPQRGRRADDEFLCLDEEEEAKSASEEHRPYPERDRFGAEYRLQERKVGKKELQDRDRGDAERQVRVAEMRRDGQRAVEQIAAVQQV